MAWLVDGGLAGGIALLFWLGRRRRGWRLGSGCDWPGQVYDSCTIRMDGSRRVEGWRPRVPVEGCL
jgi:hypothetical protein